MCMCMSMCIFGCFPAALQAAVLGEAFPSAACWTVRAGLHHVLLPWTEASQSVRVWTQPLIPYSYLLAVELCDSILCLLALAAGPQVCVWRWMVCLPLWCAFLTPHVPSHRQQHHHKLSQPQGTAWQRGQQMPSERADQHARVSNNYTKRKQGEHVHVHVLS